MTSAFISYADDDAAEFVDFLEALLIDWGVDVFRDRHNLGSGPYVRQFEREIPKREFFLNVVSKCAESSDWVDAEIQLAFRKRKKHKMVPLKLHSISLDDKLILGMLQYIDFTGWHNNHDVYDATFELARFMKIRLSNRECRASTDAAFAKIGKTRGRFTHRRASYSIEKDTYSNLEIDPTKISIPGPAEVSENGGDKPLYRTGQRVPSTGIYKWAMYSDGTSTPLPTREERSIRLLRGKRFPRIHSARKDAYWRRNGWYPRSQDIRDPQKPGEIADNPGEFVERGPRGSEIRRPHLVTIDRGDKLPPTQMPGRTWERIGPRKPKGGTSVAEYKTGEHAPLSGRYDWVRYTDGTRTPRPTREEQRIRLTAGEKFPPISSCNKGAVWRGPV